MTADAPSFARTFRASGASADYLGVLDHLRANVVRRPCIGTLATYAAALVPLTIAAGDIDTHAARRSARRGVRVRDSAAPAPVFCDGLFAAPAAAAAAGTATNGGGSVAAAAAAAAAEDDDCDADEAVAPDADAETDACALPHDDARVCVPAEWRLVGVRSARVIDEALLVTIGALQRCILVAQRHWVPLVGAVGLPFAAAPAHAAVVRGTELRRLTRTADELATVAACLVQRDADRAAHAADDPGCATPINQLKNTALFAALFANDLCAALAALVVLATHCRVALPRGADAPLPAGPTMIGPDARAPVRAALRETRAIWLRLACACAQIRAYALCADAYTPLRAMYLACMGLVDQCRAAHFRAASVYLAANCAFSEAIWCRACALQTSPEHTDNVVYGGDDGSDDDDDTGDDDDEAAVAADGGGDEDGDGHHAHVTIDPLRVVREAVIRGVWEPDGSVLDPAAARDRFMQVLETQRRRTLDTVGVVADEFEACTIESTGIINVAHRTRPDGSSAVVAQAANWPMPVHYAVMCRAEVDTAPLAAYASPAAARGAAVDALVRSIIDSPLGRLRLAGDGDSAATQ